MIYFFKVIATVGNSMNEHEYKGYVQANSSEEALNTVLDTYHIDNPPSSITINEKGNLFSI